MKLNQELARVCAMLGDKIPLWTQANGSNISVKFGDRLWIKASGFRLDAVTHSHGIARLNIPHLVGGLKTISSASGNATSGDDAYFATIRQSAAQEGSPFQPSMESGFHSVLTRRWVMHLHSLAAIILARPEHAGYASDLGKKLGEKITILPEAAPGLELTEAIAKNPDSRIYLLSNHGVILQQDDTPDTKDGVLAIWREIERRVRPLMRPASILHRPLLGNGPVDLSSLLRETPPSPWRFYFPDAVVFHERCEKILTKVDTRMGESIFSIDPQALATDSKGLPNPARDAAEIAIATFLLHDACPLLEQLPAKRLEQIRNMASEKHRKGIAA